MKEFIVLPEPNIAISQMRAMLCFPNDVEQRNQLARRFRLTDKIQKLGDEDELSLPGRDLKFMIEMHDSLRLKHNATKGIWQSRLAGSQLLYYWALHAAGRDTSHAKAMKMVEHLFRGERYKQDNSLIALSEKPMKQYFERSYMQIGIAAAYEYLLQINFDSVHNKSPYKDAAAFAVAMSYAEAFVDFGMSHIAKGNYANNKPLLSGGAKILVPRGSYFNSLPLPESVSLDADTLKYLDSIYREKPKK